jgi:hypothetical protein
MIADIQGKHPLNACTYIYFFKLSYTFMLLLLVGCFVCVWFFVFFLHVCVWFFVVFCLFCPLMN